MNILDTLLFGNGINIQYGGEDNLNKAIILRAIDNVYKDKIPKHVLIDEPDLLLSFFGTLFREIDAVLKGEYNQLAITSDEKKSISYFLEYYSSKKSLNITSIGFEDYYLVLDLMFRKNKITNPDAYFTRETFKRFFIHSIYNDGKVNQIYKYFPDNFRDFFNDFDTLFTTNYDRNIEFFTNRKVYYLHGAFHIKADVYDENSLRNYMSDRPLDNIEIDPNYHHLYSNALTTYNGNHKLFSIKQGLHANQAIEKFKYAYSTQEGVRRDIESWANDDNELVRKLHESIKLKDDNPKLAFAESYPIKEFETIKGNLTILGLAPNNDTHIFDIINNNDNIDKVTYYYYSSNQNHQIENMLDNKTLILKDVKLLWNKYK
ncbi:MAG TPA: hypothetical protein GX707_01535 [Epulopiscium sp.]|nr:hypothetical protein [Candidatus Epulonipiscium sp.]